MKYEFEFGPTNKYEVPIPEIPPELSDMIEKFIKDEMIAQFSLKHRLAHTINKLKQI